MSVPLFANGWYGKLPEDEVRKEVQALYNLVDEAAAGGFSGDWADLTGVPTLFPPTSHTHLKAEITDFAHTHVAADITDLASYTGLDVRYYTESEVNSLLGSYLPLTGGTLTGPLVIESATTELLELRRASGPRSQLFPGLTVNETFLRNVLSDGTVDGSVIIQGDDDTVRFRPGDTGGTRHEMWHNGNVVITTNADGTSIRFPNGVQVCRHTLNLGSRRAFGAGTLADPYRTNVSSPSFPQAFNATPSITFGHSVNSGTAAARAMSVGTQNISSTGITSLQAVALSSNTTVVDCEVYYIAIGTWS